MYSKDLIETLLKETDIVTVISAFIPVQQKGRSFVAVCPFHDDKNPSLNISREKQIFKCFVCGTGGNAITFVQKHLNISYQEAVQKVAEISGFHDERLEKEAYKPQVDNVKQPLFDTINDLQTLYQYCLNTPEAKDAQNYLSNRHIDKDEIKKYGIGYSLTDGKKTVEYLQRKGHSLDKIKGIGIVSSVSNSDANAGRIIFPLKDKNGQVIGFSARKINPNDHDSPKYVNSPDTKIFKKSLNLYNYNNAKNSARTDGYIYVLEGFMDVMALDKADIPSAVALMGTSLSVEQIELLRQLNCEIRLCLDGDAAGQRGMMKIILQLNKAGLPFRLVCNPNDLRDPDDILQESGPEALRNAMNQLVDSFQFQMNYYQNVEHLTKAEDKKKVLMYSIPFLRSMKPGIDRENNIVRLSKITGYEPEIIRNQLTNSDFIDNSLEEVTYQDQQSFELFHPETKYVKKLAFAEKQTLYYMLQNIDAVKYFEQNIDNFYYQVYEKIASFIIEYVDKNNEIANIPVLFNEIETSDDNDKDEMNRVLSELADGNLPYEPYSEDNMASCAKAIKEGKEDISTDLLMKKRLSDPGQDIGQALNDFKNIKNKQLSERKKK